VVCPQCAFTASPRDNPKPNADGTLTLYFQNETPGKDKEANWLPAPKGEFVSMMRMYWPEEKFALDHQRVVEASSDCQSKLTI
jgi:hypothetical protein